MLPLLSEQLPPRWRDAATGVVDQLFSVVGDLDKTRPGSRKMFVLYSGIMPIMRTSSLGQLLDAFRADLQLTVATWAPRKLFVHAGAVSWHGVAILVPGLSYSGKTTLVAELVRQGASYLSDEYAIIDKAGRVEAFPRPLQVRSEVDFEQHVVLPETLGRQAVRERPRIGLVVSTRYKSGAIWRPGVLSEGRGLLKLMENTVAARIRPKFALSRLAVATRGTEFLHGVRGDAVRTAGEILDHVAERVELRSA